MKFKQILIRALIWLAIAILQYVMAMLITFLGSLVIGDLGTTYLHELPLKVIVLLGFTYSAGIFLMGWLSLKLQWRGPIHRYPIRLITAVIGTFIPLLVAILLYPAIEPGNPFLFIAVITGILGFFVPEWIQPKA